MNTPTETQLDHILSRAGHEPCEGVEILQNHSLGSAAGGEALRATIFRPQQRSATPSPAMLTFHGGGFQNGDPNGCGAIGKYLAISLGVTTVSASYRLATEARKTFPGVLDDIWHAWRWVQSQATSLNIDPKRVVAGGNSAGAFMAAHLAVASPFVPFDSGENRPAALVANWGPIDFVARWYDRGESPGAERTLLGTNYTIDPALYHRASPITYATANLPPALFVYGRQDRTVHPRQGELGQAAWKAAGAHSELAVINNLGHGIEGDGRPSQLQWLQTLTEFLDARL